jgi:hypothetical protein
MVSMRNRVAMLMYMRGIRVEQWYRSGREMARWYQRIDVVENQVYRWENGGSGSTR